MTRIAAIAVLALLAAAPPAAAQSVPAVSEPTVPERPAPEPSSSQKVRDNPAGQYLLIKTMVNQAVGAVDARALPVEPGRYNLLKYCWTAENVLGGWSERAGLAGNMIVTALETRSWQRDLARAGYAEAPVAAAIGRYEAMVLAAEFTDAVRARAIEGLAVDLRDLKRGAPGAADVHAIHRCRREARSLALNYRTVPEGGRARFIPALLHRLCQAQQLDASDPVRCDYWMNGRTDGPMSFVGETNYAVRWPDGTTSAGRFDAEEARSAGVVTLRLKSATTQ